MNNRITSQIYISSYIQILVISIYKSGLYFIKIIDCFNMNFKDLAFIFEFTS